MRKNQIKIIWLHRICFEIYSQGFIQPQTPPPQIGGTPQTGRNSGVNFSYVIHTPKNPPDPPIREILYNLLIQSLSPS